MDSTSERTTRIIVGMEKIATLTTTLNRESPSVATMTMANKMPGMATWISTRRMMMASAFL